jgi:hypothetical protein
MRRFRELGLALVLWSATAAAATAQTGASQWELDVHGGGAFPMTSASGDVALPPVSSNFSSVFPDSARIVSSWYFGDGAAQFNAAVSSIPLTAFAPLVPLDHVLQARFGERQAGFTGGLRMSRVLTPRFSAEFSFDAADTPLALAAASLTGIEASRLTFEYAWNNLLAGPSGRTQTVTSAARLEDHRGRQFTTTGALIVNVMTRGPLTPYVAVGAGAVTHSGGTPSAHLTGSYAFTSPPPLAVVPPGFPSIVVNDVDAVTIHTVVGNQFALALGGGFKCATGSRLGVRVDIRDNIARDSQKTLIDAAPTRVPSASSLIIGTTPRLVFGSSAVLRQTLSDANISNFETYSATGTQHNVHLTAGIYWKF